jgi:single-strand DNA-binding protein
MRCQVELVGRLSEDPDLRTYPNGDRLALLTVATEDGWQDRQTGERKVRTTWHTVRVSKLGVVKAVGRDLARGDLVMVVGALRYSEWIDDQQIRRRTAEIVVKAADHVVLFLGAARPEPPG